MKKLKIITVLAIILLVAMTGFSSCVVRQYHDNGYHRGWYKHKNHRENNVYIIKEDNHKQQNGKQNVKDKSRKKDHGNSRK